MIQHYFAEPANRPSPRFEGLPKPDAGSRHPHASLGPRKKTILVLYYSRGVYPLRDTIEAHLYCWRRYSKHHVVYVNLRFGFPRRLIKHLQIDAIVFHTIFLNMRWSPELFRKVTKECEILRHLDCVKIAMPQDEFLNTELLNDFIQGYRVTDVLTCASEKDWPFVYDKLDRTKVRFRTILTGYLDEETVRRIEAKKARRVQRDIDVGYRAWRAEYWLGEHGQSKVRIAEVFEQACRARSLRVDISTRTEDVIAGDAWFDYLLRCRSTIGVAGGASVLDRRGDIRRRVDAYLVEHPAASFEQTRQDCFPDEDHKLGLACISPRHLEACATETLQFLVVGTFNGILRPWQHYVPIEKDFSNVDEALQVLADDEKVREITTRAYRDVVASARWSYRDFIGELERDLVDPLPGGSLRPDDVRQRVFRALLGWRDSFGWKWVRFEVWFLSDRRRRRFALAVYRLLGRSS